jgi:glycosyltransferase involved in cell wall biosynthesis
VKKKKVIISVISDLVTDQRVHKTAQCLHEQGFNVLLIGRKMKKSAEMPPRDYRVKRVVLPFETSFLFYASYNIWNFFFLLFNKVDILHSNDLDTLFPNFLISKLKGIPLVYDSHEYFTGVPEIKKKPFVRFVWGSIEKYVFPKLKYVYTVNQSIANIYEGLYNVKVGVVRNVSFLNQENLSLDRSTLPEQNVIVYQGMLNMDRGLEEVILAMQYVDNIKFIIIGGGDVEHKLQELVKQNNLESKVEFTGKLQYKEMIEITKKATIGISVEKPTNENYIYCLPNKVFDYLHAGIPILTSRLIEIESIVTKYDVGTFLESHIPKEIASKLNEVINNKEQLIHWKKNTQKAALACNWQLESELIKNIYAKL